MSYQKKGHHVSTVDTNLSPVRPPEIEILTKNILAIKTKMVEYCSGTALVRLTPTFHMSYLQKYNY